MTEAAPIAPNRTLRRLPNATYRQKEYLTEAEVERLIEAARRRGRNGARDAAAILLAYRHGLRAAELCQLRWSQIDLRHGRLHVNRAKGGCASVHPLHRPELRALRPFPTSLSPKRARQQPRRGSYEWSSERGEPSSFPSRSIPHAKALDRIQARQRRSRHAIAGALPWASQFAINGALHGTSAG